MKATIQLAFVFPLALAIAGCEDGDARSPYDIRVSQGRSALGFSKRIEASAKRLDELDGSIRERCTSLPSYADRVGDADPAAVLEVVEASQRAGRDGAYADEHRRLASVDQFFDDEQAELTRKVGGAAQYAAKQGGCSVDVYGPVSGALKSTVTERRRERLREHNDAFVLIERRKGELGKKNVGAVEELADVVAGMSHAVERTLPDARRRFTNESRAAGEAQSALGTFIADEQRYQKEAGRTPEELKASEARVKEAEDEKAKLAEAKRALDQRIEGLEKKRAELTRVCDEGHDQLERALRAKAKK
jgi:hypothetical protein